MKKLLEIRTTLIIGAVLFSLVISTAKCVAMGWPFHIPEIDGGLEIAYENMKPHKEDKFELDPC